MTEDKKRSGRSLRFELIVAFVGLALGFVVLPALIYAVGGAMLGPYSGGAHRMGSFYGDIYRDLGRGGLSAWCLVIGPYVIVLLLRLIFFGRPPTVTVEKEKPPRSRERVRKEPRVS